MPAHAHLGYQNPVIPVDSPDPGVFYDEASSTWYAYATNGNGKNIQVFSSKDFCSWDSDHEDALPGPFPDWIREGGWWWAPEVIRAPGGRPGYLMYTTCGIKAIDGQGICTAYSESPLGPFKLVGDGPLVDIPNGSLDAQPFENPQENGKRYLVYKNDEDGQMYTKKTQLWIQPLTEDGLRFEGPRQPLLAPTMEWQHGLLEGPYLTYHAPSRTYTLFYSSGTFTTGGYAIGYAKSSSMFGPYKASDHPFLWTDEQRGVLGPGGQCIVRGVEGHDFLVFHSLTHFEGPRHMCVHRLEWGNDGTPILPGRPQLNKRLRLGAEAEDDDQGGKPCPLPKEHYGGGGKEPKDRAREYAKKGVGALASWAKKQL